MTRLMSLTAVSALALSLTGCGIYTKYENQAYHLKQP